MSTNYWPDTTRVTHGGFTLDLGRDAIRNVTYNGAQLIDLLYTAIRPSDWSTLKSDEHVSDVQVIGSSCVITITESMASAIVATTKVTLSDNKSFSVDYQLKGLADYQVSAWFGIFGPADIPGAIVNKLNLEITAVIKSPEMQKRLRELGAEPETATPQEYERFVREEATKWATVVKLANLAP